MHASELKRNMTTRYRIFTIDDVNYIEILPTTTKAGSDDLKKSAKCCSGSADAMPTIGTMYKYAGTAL